MVDRCGCVLLVLYASSSVFRRIPIPDKPFDVDDDSFSNRSRPGGRDRSSVMDSQRSLGVIAEES